MKVKVTERHDRLSCRIASGNGQRITLTINRRGKGASGANIDAATLDRVFRAFAAFVGRNGSYGERLAEVARCARAATDFGHLASILTV